MQGMIVAPIRDFTGLTEQAIWYIWDLFTKNVKLMMVSTCGRFLSNSFTKTW